jgi:hypothetical protein
MVDRLAMDRASLRIDRGGFLDSQGIGEESRAWKTFGNILLDDVFKYCSREDWYFFVEMEGLFL